LVIVRHRKRKKKRQRNKGTGSNRIAQETRENIGKTFDCWLGGDWGALGGGWGTMQHA
jgi:hypothetical protein